MYQPENVDTLDEADLLEIQEENVKTDKEETLTEEEMLRIQEEEWRQVEELVIAYQARFKPGATPDELNAANEAADALIIRFNPLFRKYLTLFKTGQINFNDNETKMFISSFINEIPLKRALYRTKQSSMYRAAIYKKFNFIKESYGALTEEEILIDLQMLFLGMAKRYKQVGRSFCGFIYNVFKYDVTRHIKKFIANPLNFHYKYIAYEEYVKTLDDEVQEESFESDSYEDSMGIPDMSWIAGKECSEAFKCLTALERKLLVKYYSEDWNDKKIAEEFSMHINTANQKRRYAAAKLAKALNIDPNDIKRKRKSGKSALSSTY